MKQQSRMMSSVAIVLENAYLCTLIKGVIAKLGKKYDIQRIQGP
jgi:hypothetical protein